MGEEDGSGDGEEVGALDGRGVVGNIVGTGEMVGVMLGLGVGSAVGRGVYTVGAGELDGAALGAAVGLFVGVWLTVGAALVVGSDVGLRDGSGVGAHTHSSSSS